MKRVLFVLMCCLLTFLLVELSQAEIVETIVAVVNDEIITLSELKEFLSPIQARIEGRYHGKSLERKTEEVRWQALTRMIEEKILLGEAKNMDIEIRAEKIERKLNDLKSRFASEDDFKRALKESGLSEERLRKKIEEQMMVQKLLDWKIKEVRSKIRIDREEIKNFYEENKERFREPEMVELSHILIKVKGESGWPEAEQRAKDIFAKLKEGASFSLMAKQYSEGPEGDRGGRLGFLTLGQLLPEFEEAVSKMEVGEISGPIRAETGFHIIRLEGRKSARQKELSEVADEIERWLFAEKANEMYREWVNELREKAYVRINIQKPGAND